MLVQSAYISQIGNLTLAAEDGALVGLWIQDQKYFAAGLPVYIPVADNPVFQQASVWLDCYFSGAILPSLPPLAPKGSEFQQAVWRLLLEIPYGETTTYGKLATRLRASGIRASAQAVGGAVGRNPISLMIPCHRVVGADGSLTGYAGGIEIKRRLLELEGINMCRLC